HAAVGLVGTALIQHHFAGGFFGTGEHAAHHAGGGPRSERLGDVARITDTAIGNERNARAVKRLGDVGNGGDLGYAHARNDARGADGTWADTDLDGVGAGVNQCARCSGRGDVAANDLDARVVVFDPAHAVDNALRMAVSRVDDERIDAGSGQLGDAFVGALAHAHGGRYAQLTLGVFAGAGVLGVLDDVFNGSQTTQFEGVVHDEHALEPVLVHERLGFFERGAFVHGHQPFLRGHDFAQGQIEAVFETQVAVGDDTHQLAAFDHGQARNAMGALQLDGIAHAHVGRDGDGVDDNTKLVGRDASNFTRPRIGREVLVDDADPAFLGHGDGQARLGDGVHCGGHQRDVEHDVAREPGGKIGIARKDV